MILRISPQAARSIVAAGFAAEGRHRTSCHRDGTLVDDIVMARVDVSS